MGAAASLVSDRVQYSWELRELGLLRCEVESLRPPPGEVICCLARIMGESHDSGRVPGLDRIMDNRISSGGSRTFGGKSRDPLSFSRSGLIMGDFRSGVSSHEGRDAGKTATTGGPESMPIFEKEKWRAKRCLL